MNATDSEIVIAVTLARKAEVLLAGMGANGDGLGKKIQSAKSRLSKLSPRFLSNLQLFTAARNDIVHAKPATTVLPEAFVLFCKKLELEIEHYGAQLGIALPRNAHEATELPSIATPSPAPIIEAEVQLVEGEEENSESSAIVGCRPQGPRYFIVDGTDGLGDFDSVQSAIDHARDGDCIRVMPGKYREVLRIDKVLTLEGQGAIELVIIEGDADVLYVSGKGAQISGFTIAAKAEDIFGIVAVGGAIVKVANCHFMINDGIGLMALESSFLRVENTTVTDCRHGVRAEGATVELTRNRFERNTNAILLHAGSLCRIANSAFNNNGTALEVSDTATVTVEHNEFTSGENSAAALVVHPGALGVVAFNTFSRYDSSAVCFCPDGASQLDWHDNTTND